MPFTDTFMQNSMRRAARIRKPPTIAGAATAGVQAASKPPVSAAPLPPPQAQSIRPQIAAAPIEPPKSAVLPQAQAPISAAPTPIPEQASIPGPPTPSKKSVYDLQRERIQGDAALSDERQREALMRSLNDQGITDSGIRGARERTADVDARTALARELGGVDIAEAGASENATEADLNRALEREKMAQQGGQFNQGLAAQERMAGMGFANQRSMAELSASMQKDFATFQNDLSRSNKPDDLRMLYLSEKLAGLDPKDPLFQQKLYEAINTFQPGLNLGPAPVTTPNTKPGGLAFPEGAKTPPNGMMKLPMPSIGGRSGGFRYWNPDTGQYEFNPNPRYAAYYK